jgi:hypothetical protein
MPQMIWGASKKKKERKKNKTLASGDMRRPGASQWPFVMPLENCRPPETADKRHGTK